MFTNFLAYKLERKGAKFVEIDRWFPSSKLCSNCFYRMGEMSLDVREWTCPDCSTYHDRDGNAAINIRAVSSVFIGVYRGSISKKTIFYQTQSSFRLHISCKLYLGSIIPIQIKRSH